MSGSRHLSVVILYTHPLLGEGLSHVLATEPDLDVVAVATDDTAGVRAALAQGPDVVIVERSAPLAAVDVLRFAPNALLIDVGMDPGPSFTYRREEIPARPEGILGAIQVLRTQAGLLAGTVAFVVAGFALAGLPGLG